LTSKLPSMIFYSKLEQITNGQIPQFDWWNQPFFMIFHYQIVSNSNHFGSLISTMNSHITTDMGCPHHPETTPMPGHFRPQFSAQCRT
jgi:hypothetical protein